jgi:hypothetical protein
LPFFSSSKNAVHSVRTGETVRKNALDAVEHGDHCLGFRGKSVLMYVPHFGITKNVPVDYMHGVLLGVTKKLVELWFDSQFSTSDFSLYNHRLYRL